MIRRNLINDLSAILIAGICTHPVSPWVTFQPVFPELVVLVHCAAPCDTVLSTYTVPLGAVTLPSGEPVPDRNFAKLLSSLSFSPTNRAKSRNRLFNLESAILIETSYISTDRYIYHISTRTYFLVVSD